MGATTRSAAWIICLALFAIGCGSGDSADAGTDAGDATAPLVDLGPTCGTAADCRLAGPCETPIGATCEGGRCRYPALVCATSPPAACVDPMTLQTYMGAGACTTPPGSCRWPLAHTDCGDTHGGCHLGAQCDSTVSPAVCMFTTAADGADCMVSTGAAGHCVGGDCRECDSVAQCDDGDPCTVDDCGADGVCAHVITAGGTCDDADDCTFTDVCLSDGSCVGTSITCDDDAPPCGVLRACNGTSACTVTSPPPACADSATCCGAGSTCHGGDDGDPANDLCCADAAVVCGGTCCTAPGAVCAAGVCCVPTCTGATCGADDGCGGTCLGTCVDPGDHCDAATHACVADVCTPACSCGQICIGGTCAPLCAAGETLCGCAACCATGEICDATTGSCSIP